MVQPALPAATSHLELAALGAGLRAGPGVVITWSSAEVLAGLTAGAIALKKKALVTGRALKSELVEGHDLATGGEDSGAGGFGEFESADGHLGDGEEPLIVDDLADNDSDGAVFLALEGERKARDGERTAVGVGKAEAMGNLLVEVVSGAAGNECVEAVQHLHVHVLGGWSAASLAANAVVKVNTHEKGRPCQNRRFV